METFSALLVLGEGNPRSPVDSLKDVFFDLRLNKRLSNQWFETPSHSLWRHCNVEGWWLKRHRSINDLLLTVKLIHCDLVFRMKHSVAAMIHRRPPSTCWRVTTPEGENMTKRTPISRKVSYRTQNFRPIDSMCDYWQKATSTGKNTNSTKRDCCGATTVWRDNYVSF